VKPECFEAINYKHGCCSCDSNSEILGLKKSKRLLIKRDKEKKPIDKRYQRYTDSLVCLDLISSNSLGRFDP
jgi:hypothetical protein